MNVIGVSGSAIKNSNTDRGVKMVLEATGLETEFIKLSDYTVAPCTACLGCVHTNRCVIEDDGIEIAEKVKAADALVIGGYTPYSSLNALTKCFIERMYPLRHLKGFQRGKPGVGVVTFAAPEDNPALPRAAETGVNTIAYYMMRVESVNNQKEVCYEDERRSTGLDPKDALYSPCNSGKRRAPHDSGRQRVCH